MAMDFFTRRKRKVDLSDDPALFHLQIRSETSFIVIDWDDTLLPTTWLARNEIHIDTPFIPAKDEEKLHELDMEVVGLLRKLSLIHGHVLIITNAQQGWVELSSRKFLPETHEFLFACDNDSKSSSRSYTSSSFSDFNKNPNVKLSPGSRKRNRDGSSKALPLPENLASNGNELTFSHPNGKIGVYSARHLFEKDFPNNPSAWKKHAFQKLLRSRIPPNFLAPLTEHLRQKSLSTGDLDLNLETILEEKDAVPLDSSSVLESCVSDLSSLDLSELIGFEEFETDLDGSDSFFDTGFDAARMVKRTRTGDEFSDGSLTPPPVFENLPLESNTPSTRLERITCCNLLSIGDCHHDVESLQTLDLNLKNTVKKTIKLISFPSVLQLTAELKELQMYLGKVVKLKREVQLEVDKKLFANFEK